MKSIRTLIAFIFSFGIFGLDAQNCASLSNNIVEVVSTSGSNTTYRFTFDVGMTSGGSQKALQLTTACGGETYINNVCYPNETDGSSKTWVVDITGPTCTEEFTWTWIGKTTEACGGTDCCNTPSIGTISGPTAVCFGSTTTLELSSATGSIQWYKKLSTEEDYILINNATSLSITDNPGAVGTWDYQVVVSPGSGCTEGPLTETYNVTVDATSIGGTITGDNCGGSFNLPASTGLMTLEGYTGTILKWQRRINGTTWEDIANTDPTLTESFENTPENAGVYEYRAEIQNGTCPAIFSAECTIEFAFQAPQPVELVSFSGELVDRRSYLKWTTASEVDNEGFLMLRSPDGIEWKQIGFTLGHGTTNQSRSYTFIDDAPLSALNYYRLAQRDFNGKIEFSKVISLDMTVNGASYGFYPNPASQQLTIVSSEETTANLQLYDVFGRLCLLKFIEGPEQTISLSGCAPGLYQVVLTEDEQIWTEKLLVK